MDKLKISQIFKVLAIAAFLILTPLLSTSLRPTYLYFVLNLLIIALGAEAGLLSFIFKAAEEKKAAVAGFVAENSKPAATNLAVAVTEKPQMASEAVKTDEKPQMASEAVKTDEKPQMASKAVKTDEKLEEVGNSTVNEMAAASDHAKPKTNKVVQKWSSEKIINVGSLKHMIIKKCPSILPSLFFIGDGAEADQPEESVEDEDEEDDDDDQESFGGLSGQELFQKTETFIGNFYKQLKDAKKLHEIYCFDRPTPKGAQP